MFYHFLEHSCISPQNGDIVSCISPQNGDIVMFQGMMDLLDNDDQLTIVLAHEMSHAILEHAVSGLFISSIVFIHFSLMYH